MPASDFIYSELASTATDDAFLQAQVAARMLDNYVHRNEGGILLRYVTGYRMGRSGALDGDWGAICDTRIESISTLRIGEEEVDATEYRLLETTQIELDVEPYLPVELDGWIGWGEFRLTGTAAAEIPAAGTAVALLGTTALPAANFYRGQLFRVEDEIIEVGRLGGSLMLERGRGGTTAAVHAAGTEIKRLVLPSDLKHLAETIAERTAGQSQRAADDIEGEDGMVTMAVREWGLTYNLGAFLRKYQRMRVIDTPRWSWNSAERSQRLWLGY